MIKKFSPIFTTLILSSLIFSCDKIDQPIPESEDETIDTSSSIQWDTARAPENNSARNIVIEEFTGHTCPNCPEGAKEIERLDSIYGAQVIPVSIHAGTFAETESNPDDSYSTDFRTTAGEEYNNTFTVPFYPAAMISRIENGAGSGNYIYTKGDWETVIQSVLSDQPLIKIELTSLWSDSLSAGKVLITTEWLQDVPDNYKLQVQLLEDHITDWQKSGSQDVEDYDHRHALRKAINSTWGTLLSTSTNGEREEFEFDYQPDANWKSDDLIVVAYVYRDGDYEVIQGAEVHVKDH